MRKLLLLPILTLCSSAVLAADNSTYITGSPDRSELLKAAVNRDRGTISALEPSTKDSQGVYVGYSSGVVLNCYSSNRCLEFSDTPSTPVQRIAITRRGDKEIVWVSYRQGAMYQCIDGECARFLWERAPGE